MVPQRWAATQSNLGGALQALGARESGTAKLEQAVVAFREALKEQTRERAPLDWGRTHHNLGNALARLGDRDSGTAKLEEAVVAYGEALKELHEITANFMLAIVGVHIAGVLIGTWLHQDNLIGAMLTGRKSGHPNDAVRSAWRSVAVLMVAAVLAFWTLQWQSAPVPSAANGTSASARHHDRDDD